MKKLLIVILLVFPILSFGNWWITEVDNGGYGETSIALDSLGYPHTAYMYGLKGSLKYASWNPDSSWTIEEITGSGSYPQLKFDSKWHPHIAYLCQKYGYKDSIGWHIEQINFPLIIGWDEGCISMDLDSKNYPHIIGSNSVWMPPKGLYHFWKDSLDWHYDIIDDVASCQYGSAIVIDDKDSIHISYPGPEGLIYARKRESGWDKEIVDASGISMSMALDSLWQPCIAYRSNGKLKYAKKDSTKWKIVIIDTPLHHGIVYPSLCIDFYNLPRISYVCDRNLKYAWFNGNNWNITIIEDSIYNGWSGLKGMEVGKDNSGHSHIVYDHQFEKSIKYAKGHEFIGIEENEKLKVKSKKLEISPNPFVKSAIIQGFGNRDLESEIYNIVGRLIKKTKSNIIGKELHSGIYFVKAKGYKPVKIIKMGGIR